MFFRERSTQAEYFDVPDRPKSEMVEAYRELDRINRFFQFTHPFIRGLPRWLGRNRCQRLDILDVGAGSGLLGKRLSNWAQRRGWDWRFTNLDTNPIVLNSEGAVKVVLGSALNLPFEDGSFDLVVASQMTHHLTEVEIVRHWREAWRVTRDAIFICDLHRNAFLYGMLWLTLRLMRVHPELLQDGLISVQRGFHRREWWNLAAQAEIPDSKVWVYYGTRIVLQARKGAR
jgi:2-polyprenyl-3-methyl-5-hydroxy-6-metoxy-1,4-benzoquinol methylase